MQQHRIGKDDKTGTYRITVFPRKLKDRVIWYARYTVSNPNLANNQRHITESLKTDNEDTALEKARQRFAEIKVKEEAGIALKPLTVEECIDKFVTLYKENLDAKINGYSQSAYLAYEYATRLYWIPYIGSRALSSITEDDMSGYERWRKAHAQRTDIKKHKAAKAEIVKETLLKEINSFRAILRWASKKGYYTGRAFDWKYNIKEKAKRTGLTLQQYMTLSRYMKTKPFFEKGRFKPDKVLMRHRVMLKTFILFMIQTGLRPGEVRLLKFGQCTERKNKDGKNVLSLYVIDEHSKTRKGRTCIGRARANRALVTWKFYRRMKCKEVVTDDSYVFCDEKGKPFKSLREGVQQVLKEAGVARDYKGHLYSVYSLRHSYAQFMLQYSKVDSYRLARQMGTSEAMIRLYYSDVVNEDFIDWLS